MEMALPLDCTKSEDRETVIAQSRIEIEFEEEMPEIVTEEAKGKVVELHCTVLLECLPSGIGRA
jgi:hypothetical protein